MHQQKLQYELVALSSNPIYSVDFEGTSFTHKNNVCLCLFEAFLLSASDLWFVRCDIVTFAHCWEKLTSK